MKFKPVEVLFSPTADCNLNCRHCEQEKSKINLPVELAENFLYGCKKAGVERIGFTGGEPFLNPEFIYKIAGLGVELDMYFGRLMTNGVWFRDKAHLESVLYKLYDYGYDGTICVSADAFHGKNPGKIVTFIETALKIWGRGDLISIASVRGARVRETMNILKAIASGLGAKLELFPGGAAAIKSSRLFIPVNFIELSPVGKASRIKNPWDGKWFKEDYCAGPGNVFMVEADGSVKPCCGYASHKGLLAVGNIARDGAAGILGNIESNFFARAVFTLGLSGIRKKMEKNGVKFPSKTSNHCFFCNYIIEKFPAFELMQLLA